MDDHASFLIQFSIDQLRTGYVFLQHRGKYLMVEREKAFLANT